MILDGKKIAGEIYTHLQQNIQKLDIAPTIWVILVWSDDSPSMRYIKAKRFASKNIWMNFHLSQFQTDISEIELIQEIQRLNEDRNISWFMVQTPLPAHINTMKILNAINPLKDIDGFHPINQGKVMIWDTSWLTPCTPAGIMKIFSYYNIELLGKKVVVLWRSNIVGKPVVNLLIHAGATVSNCNSHTPNIAEYTKNADIVISATGQAGIISAEMVQKDAVIIDVGFSLIDGKITWDCDYESLSEQGNPITPVPWGVGPMTVAMLLQNTYFAHMKHHEL